MADQSKLIEQLQRRLQILEDKDRLTALLNEYGLTADTHDWEGFANTFLPDGVMAFNGWGDVVGRKNIAQAAGAEEVFESVQHLMTNMQFELGGSNPDKATGTACLWFCATPEIKVPTVNYAWGGPYRFQFDRTDRGWKIARVDLKRVWSQGKDTKGVFNAD